MIETNKMLEYAIYFFLPFLAGLTVLFIGTVMYRIYRIKLKRATRSIFHSAFKGREKEIRRLVQQVEIGQSGAIIGVFSSEKSAILDYLRDEKIYEIQSDQFVLSYLDISDTIEKECTPAQFWQYALEPLQKEIAKDTNSALFGSYQSCQKNNFSNRFLEKLLEQMKHDNWRLVLLINRFEVLLHLPNLNQPEFFGGLRLLAASSYPSPISLIISLNQSITQFHRDTKALNPVGSPYLNFLESGAITLGALSDSQINKWLEQEEHQFNETERDFLKTITGNHPYLLQIAASILIEAKENQEENPIENAKELFADRTENMLVNLLQTWPSNICKTFIEVAQKRDVSSLNRELKELKKQGFIDNIQGKWQIRSSVFAEFVADKTVQELCQQKQNNGKT